MEALQAYRSRIDTRGGTIRQASLLREKQMLVDKLQRSLAYQSVVIDDADQNVAIINSDNLNEKMIYSLPGEDIILGSEVEWMDNVWLVTERDANSEVYTRAKMLQCNYLLKWVSLDEDNVPQIHQEWCVIDDGTKYMAGDYVDRDFIVTRGDMRIAMIIQRNSETIKFGRDSRFLIDDPDTTSKYAFALTKPLKVGNTYNFDGVQRGVLKFVLSESDSTDFDNFDLSIPDYYKYFDEDGNAVSTTSSSSTIKLRTSLSSSNSGGEEVWI